MAIATSAAGPVTVPSCRTSSAGPWPQATTRDRKSGTYLPSEAAGSHCGAPDWLEAVFREQPSCHRLSAPRASFFPLASRFVCG